jgi:hypothetical protein
MVDAFFDYYFEINHEKNYQQNDKIHAAINDISLHSALNILS